MLHTCGHLQALSASCGVLCTRARTDIYDIEPMLTTSQCSTGSSPLIAHVGDIMDALSLFAEGGRCRAIQRAAADCLRSLSSFTKQDYAGLKAMEVLKVFSSLARSARLTGMPSHMRDHQSCRHSHEYLACHERSLLFRQSGDRIRPGAGIAKAQMR